MLDFRVSSLCRKSTKVKNRPYLTVKRAQKHNKNSILCLSYMLPKFNRSFATPGSVLILSEIRKRYQALSIMTGEGPSRGLLCDCDIFEKLRLKLYLAAASLRELLLPVWQASLLSLYSGPEEMEFRIILFTGEHCCVIHHCHPARASKHFITTIHHVLLYFLGTRNMQYGPFNVNPSEPVNQTCL